MSLSSTVTISPAITEGLPRHFTSQGVYVKLFTVANISSAISAVIYGFSKLMFVPVAPKPLTIGLSAVPVDIEVTTRRFFVDLLNPPIYCKSRVISIPLSVYHANSSAPVRSNRAKQPKHPAIYPAACLYDISKVGTVNV